MGQTQFVPRDESFHAEKGRQHEEILKKERIRNDKGLDPNVVK